MTPTLTSPLSKLSNTSGDARIDGRSVNPTGSQQSSPTRSPESSSTYKRHERFYFDDGNIVFAVQNVLYNVHRYFFCRDSSFFSNLVNNRSTSAGEARDPSAALLKPFLLKDVQSAEFDALLCILYPLKFNECEIQTVEEWSSILRLATQWSFSSIRELAISHLDSIASPIDKIVLGRTYRDRGDAWLVPAFVDMCQRAQPLTRAEGHRLDIDDTVLVAFLRESLSACPTRPTADEIYTGVEACLRSPDIADHGLIPLEIFTPAGATTPNLESSEETTLAAEPEAGFYARQLEAAESDKGHGSGGLGGRRDTDCEDGNEMVKERLRLDTTTAGAAAGSTTNIVASQLASAVDMPAEEEGGGDDDDEGKEEEMGDSYGGGGGKMKKAKAKKGKGKK
ncbi:hypothetical protein EWM64_g8020 [Hericium alpestre]|uniref:BTB domain-containing protein n=1 Tax=Hericium alpestre TaxID=135208 RepID=A0A4Y9ZQ92_9AGAM|nr:hypothetical protein EWM64_g8020 [Hericium alpestre]